MTLIPTPSPRSDQRRDGGGCLPSSVGTLQILLLQASLPDPPSPSISWRTPSACPLTAGHSTSVSQPSSTVPTQKPQSAHISSPDSSWWGALTCVVSLKLGGGIHGHLTCGTVEAPLLAPAFPTHTAPHSSCHRFRLWDLWPRLWGAGWARRRGGRGDSIQEV